jgi:hypothetical protein
MRIVRRAWFDALLVEPSRISRSSHQCCHDRLMPPALDGSLEDWADVVGRHPWQGLLLGNGMSINVWGGFAYDRLFDHAKSGALTADDLALFDGSPNFGHAVREVHLRLSDVPPTTLAVIRAEFERFEWIFTTSYDLLVYWVMAQPTWRPFVVLF